MTAPVCELEHVIGFTGKHPSSLRLHPTHESGLVYALGATVVLGDVTDPHEQIFLLGHTADVTCIDVSRSGSLVASGQMRQATVSAIVLVPLAATIAGLLQTLTCSPLLCAVCTR